VHAIARSQAQRDVVAAYAPSGPYVLSPFVVVLDAADFLAVLDLRSRTVTECNMQSNTKASEPTLSVRIIPNLAGSPASKLAEAEVIFADDGSLLSGLKLVGFAIWEAREGPNVTYPARPFVVNGERRSYALLRPVDRQELGAYGPLRRVVLQAYQAYTEREAVQASNGAGEPHAEGEEYAV
jgi:hypothetical protein